MNDGENILRIRKIVEFECKQNARGEQNEEKKNVDRITKILTHSNWIRSVSKSRQTALVYFFIVVGFTPFKSI